MHNCFSQLKPPSLTQFEGVGSLRLRRPMAETSAGGAAGATDAAAGVVRAPLALLMSTLRPSGRSVGVATGAVGRDHRIVRCPVRPRLGCWRSRWAPSGACAGVRRRCDHRIVRCPARPRLGCWRARWAPSGACAGVRWRGVDMVIPSCWTAKTAFMRCFLGSQ
jgi:hypothetical protein